MDDREVAGPRARKRWTAGAAVAICGLLASAPATAQWAVVDLPHTVKTALGWVAQYQQMIESYQRQVEQLQTLNKQYEQALVKGEAYAGTQGVRQNFQKRAPDEGVATRCGSAPARHRTGVEQHGYCVSIVRTENHRFNALVEMLEVVADRDEELRAAYVERDGIGPEEEGKLASNTNRILAIQGQLQNDVQGGERLLSAYDGALRALREHHVALANESLGGRPGAALGQGLALKLALRVARERDR